MNHHSLLAITTTTLNPARFHNPHTRSYIHYCLHFFNSLTPFQLAAMQARVGVVIIAVLAVQLLLAVETSAVTCSRFTT